MTGTPLPGVLAPLGPLLDHYGYLAVAGLIVLGLAILALIARHLARRRASRRRKPS